MYSHVYDIEDIQNFPAFGGVSERENSLVKVSGVIPGSLSLFNGFYVWFSTPYRVAHLARLKEQSRKVYKRVAELVDADLVHNQGEPVISYLINGYNKAICGFESLPVNYFSKTSIKQFLLVLAMLNLVSSDLETLRVGIVTCVYDHLSDTR